MRAKRVYPKIHRRSPHGGAGRQKFFGRWNLAGFEPNLPPLGGGKPKRGKKPEFGRFSAKNAKTRTIVYAKIAPQVFHGG